MELIWHQTDYGHTRVLECIPPHELGEWVVFHPVDAGSGVVVVQHGVSATPPPEIAAMLRVDGVWRVIADPKGYYLVTILQGYGAKTDWNQVESEIIQKLVEEHEKPDGRS